MNDEQAIPDNQPVTSSGDPTVAIAFGGGGARGLAHIHIIEVLNELGIKPVAITGSSIGALMGAGMASGLTGVEIREHTLATIGNRAEVMRKIWGLRPPSFMQAMRSGFRIGQFNLEPILKAFLPASVPEDFSALQIPLRVTATDFYGGSEVLIGEGDLFKALAASAALPAIFMPVRVDGRLMIDGGIFNPVPFDHLKGMADIVIGIDVVGGPTGEPDKVPNRMDSLFGASQLMMQSLINMKLKMDPPDVFLRPDVNRFKVMDFLKADEVLAASAGIRDELKHALDAEFAYRAKS